MSLGNGFVRLRRGILEHVHDRRLTAIEFAAYVAILAAADHRSGAWTGSARILGQLLGLSRRYSAELLAGLELKGYLSRGIIRVPGGYPIQVHKYFAADDGAPQHQGCAPQRQGCAPQRQGCAPQRQDVAPQRQDVAPQRQDVAPQRTVEIQEGRREKEEGGPERGPQTAQAENQPSPFTFSTLRLNVSIRQDKLLGEAFPWVDRSAEYRKVDSWLEANPDRRPRKVSRFLHSWFAKIPGPEVNRKGVDRVAERTRENLRAAGYLV